jgi:hypothetical protein
MNYCINNIIFFLLKEPALSVVPLSSSSYVLLIPLLFFCFLISIPFSNPIPTTCC